MLSRVISLPSHIHAHPHAPFCRLFSHAVISLVPATLHSLPPRIPTSHHHRRRCRFFGLAPARPFSPLDFVDSGLARLG
ncbi:unnamed protein product [Periconia digitata]|uniref:Uncharacterized protein n=1 Tax=Periconia digitata TaxID=1303443 RepID=A0A9W4XZ60_9PLEO|nr:unnamed protein product [Periconia digitata]